MGALAGVLWPNVPFAAGCVRAAGWRWDTFLSLLLTCAAATRPRPRPLPRAAASLQVADFGLYHVLPQTANSVITDTWGSVAYMAPVGGWVDDGE